MTQTARNYGRLLADLKIPREDVKEARRIFSETPKLLAALKSPVVTTGEKLAVIDRIFPETMHNFLKVLCGYRSVDQIADIWKAYEAYADRQEGAVQAVLYYVTAPEKEQLAGFHAYLMKKYNGQKVHMTLVYKPELVGGFVLLVGDIEEDYSIRGRLTALRQKLTEVRA